MRTPLQLFCATVYLFISAFSVAQAPVRCAEQRVTYSAENERFTGKIEVTSVAPTPPGDGEEQESTQKTRYFVLQAPDYMKSGPWTTVVWVGEATRPATLKLEFREHGSGGVQLHWLNEKLLYGSVWWGRIVSTDFIFNVETKTFLYREMANSGELIQPCH